MSGSNFITCFSASVLSIFNILLGSYDLRNHGKENILFAKIEKRFTSLFKATRKRNRPYSGYTADQMYKVYYVQKRSTISSTSGIFRRGVLHLIVKVLQAFLVDSKFQHNVGSFTLNFISDFKF